MKLDHLCITTSNYLKSIKFYTKVLHLKIISETKNFHDREFNTWLEGENFKIELQTGKKGIPTIPFNKESSGVVHFCLMVDDIQKIYEKLKENKEIKFLQKNNNDIYEVCGKKLFKIIAPEGTIIEFRSEKI